MEWVCTIIGTSLMSISGTLLVTSAMKRLWIMDAVPKQLPLQTPRPLEVWKVFGVGEVLIQEIDHQRGVVMVTPQEGFETEVWLSLEQIQNRGVMVNRSRGYTGNIDRVGRMRDRT